MANRERGELSVLGRDGETYVFALGLNAQCEIEDRMSMNERHVHFHEFIREPLDAHRIRLIFWTAAKRHHPDLSEIEVGNIVDDAFPAIGDVMTAVNQLINRGAPTPEDLKAAESVNGRPRKAQTHGRGTGGTSTLKPAASV